MTFSKVDAVFKAGNMVISFTDANNAMFTYFVNGAGNSKSISRQGF